MLKFSAAAIATTVAAAFLLAAAPREAQPSSAPAGPRRVAAGVAIDWHAGVVEVDGRIVLREGPLEFFACFPGKTHESIVLIEADALSVHNALGLAGFTPGRPSRIDPNGRWQPASGDLVDVFVRHGDGANQKTAHAFSWLLRRQTAQSPPPRPWIFGGSIRLADGSLACGRSGAALAVVDMEDALLSLAGARSSETAALWAMANTEVIPLVDTRVTLLFRRPAPLRLSIRMDHRGEIWVGDAWATLEDVKELHSLARRIDPLDTPRVDVSPALAADAAPLRALLLTEPK